MADKDFKVKNKLVLNGLAQAGILLADANKQVDSVSYLTPLQGGTGTTTAPSAGQILFSTSGTTYAPVNFLTAIFPSLTGNANKYLTNDGTSLSWVAVANIDGGGPTDTFVGMSSSAIDGGTP